MLAPGGKAKDNFIGKLFPAVILVRAGTVGTHGEGGVEQKHPLPRPAAKVAAFRNRLAKVVVDFLENIHQRRRKRHTVAHREAQAVGLVHIVIRVLTQNHHLHAVEGRGVERRKNLAPRRKHSSGGIFMLHKLHQTGEIILIPLSSESLSPAIFNLNIHNQSKKICVATNILLLLSSKNIGTHSSMDRILDSGSIDWGSTPHGCTHKKVLPQR